ncbi:DUF2288 domain-containing protein [Phormidesmis priestleyi ULC007]|uniref:DUF2288 domain-containing protein n=1 Tax=Phormidesmis priestleyi ULC007 TaxID=1920490 RepID=A0A2T1DMK7_9CYAN|nr:DUF2288 domain-containing protein [Phormidesmis priestleyi]PSB21654.1 DUF2288 domain-containing protein [Phormidesmis priestleyi ULC007]PZO50777.1 MAG: DUF2288 domain-containing protein [Phormidesmis priestleyi]
MSDLRSELTESLDEAEWNWLIPHVDRDAVIVVAPQLNLVDVGMAIVNDHSASVQHWIAEGLIYKPSEQQKTDWNAHQDKRFHALIVQPYVLVQDSIAA